MSPFLFWRWSVNHHRVYPSSGPPRWQPVGGSVVVTDGLKRSPLRMEFRPDAAERSVLGKGNDASDICEAEQE